MRHLTQGFVWCVAGLAIVDCSVLRATTTKATTTKATTTKATTTTSSKVPPASSLLSAICTSPSAHFNAAELAVASAFCTGYLHVQTAKTTVIVTTTLPTQTQFITLAPATTTETDTITTFTTTVVTDDTSTVFETTQTLLPRQGAGILGTVESVISAACSCLVKTHTTTITVVATSSPSVEVNVTPDPTTQVDMTTVVSTVVSTVDAVATDTVDYEYTQVDTPSSGCIYSGQGLLPGGVRQLPPDCETLCTDTPGCVMWRTQDSAGQNGDQICRIYSVPFDPSLNTCSAQISSIDILVYSLSIVTTPDK